MLTIEGKIIDCSSPKVMGILNMTPDSFFEGSRLQAEKQQITDRVGEMLDAGATFIDIGGYSTRPNADEVSQTEEIDRVLPVIELINKTFTKAIISIDTFRSEVAKQAIKAGGHIINDIAGGNLDEKMFETVAQLEVPYILMHSRGNPQTMTQLNDYEHLTIDVIGELQQKIFRLRQLGIKDIMLDVGFGFAKNVQQNFELLHHLEAFQIFELPLLVGLSRKSMIWRTLHIEPHEALNGTTALNMIALQKGAKILRVHDVKEAFEAIRLYEAVEKCGLH
jgi:dihydropteroate synthase